MRVLRGEATAFELIYIEFQPQLLRYLQVRESDADDLAADTWLAVVRDIGRFRGDEVAFRAWLFAIARNRSVDAGRARARRPVQLVGDDRALLDSAVPGAAEVALEHITTATALALIRELPPDQAEAISLRFIAGLDVPQVAELMSRTSGAVRVLTHRGLRTLADRLKPEV